MKRILTWLEARLSLRDSVGPMLMHPIPRRRRTDGVVVCLWQRLHDTAGYPDYFRNMSFLGLRADRGPSL